MKYKAIHCVIGFTTFYKSEIISKGRVKSKNK